MEYPIINICYLGGKNGYYSGNNTYRQLFFCQELCGDSYFGKWKFNKLTSGECEQQFVNIDSNRYKQ